jgi:glycosyltransferase involved in cell wall biosynthesis
MIIFYVTTEFIDPYNKTVIPGGLANYLHKITRALQKMGHEIHVVIIGEIKQEMEYNGISLHFIKKLLKIFVIMCKILRKLKINCLHENTLFKNNTIALSARKFLKKMKRRYNIDIVQYASYLSTGQYFNEDIPSCLRVSSYAKLLQEATGSINQAEITNEAETLKKSRFVFGPSKRTNAFITSDLNLQIEIKTIETPFVKYDSGEDNTVYNKLNAQLGGSEYVLFVGTLWNLKGSDEIAAIIYYFLRKYPQTFFVFIGKQLKNGDVPVFDFIREKALEHQNRLIWFDNLPHSTLYPIIRHARALILPSRYDNMPNVCIEAMGLKKVVLGTYEGSCDQVVEDGNNGFLCHGSNPSSLLIGMERVMDTSETELKEMGERAYLKVNDLEPEKIAEKLLDYYQYVINNWQGG